ncbi:hypothetical protein B9P52_31955 [Achromobacter denitrificans]|nr:hypothetical protein B9P52_31955 [Achromobacter denitrificans]
MGTVAGRQPLVEFVRECLLQAHLSIRQGGHARQRQARGMSVGGETRQRERPAIEGFGRDSENHFRHRAI